MRHGVQHPIHGEFSSIRFELQGRVSGLRYSHGHLEGVVGEGRVEGCREALNQEEEQMLRGDKVLRMRLDQQQY